MTKVSKMYLGFSRVSSALPLSGSVLRRRSSMSWALAADCGGVG